MNLSAAEPLVRRDAAARLGRVGRMLNPGYFGALAGFEQNYARLDDLEKALV